MTTSVFDALEEQYERLEGILGSLNEAQWDEPSLCATWSVRDVVLHLAQTEEAVVASIEERPAPIPVEGAANVDEAMEQWVRKERDTTPDVRARWKEASRAALNALRAADPQRGLQWAAAPLKPKTMATTRLSEHWIHTMDIADPLGIENPDTEPRAHRMARMANDPLRIHASATRRRAEGARGAHRAERRDRHVRGR